MITNSLSFNSTWFPSQFVEDSKRTEKWKKDSIDGAINSVLFNYHPLRKSKLEKVENYDIVQGRFSKEKIKKILNPMGIQTDDTDEEMFNSDDGYSIIRNPLETLFGEEYNRPFEPRAIVTNPEAVSTKERMIKSKILEFINSQLSDDNLDEIEMQNATEQFLKWKQYDAQTIHEKLANDIMKYYYTKLDMKQIFNEGFKDFIIAGEQIYYIYDVGGEPALKRCNPLQLLYAGAGQSNRVEDAKVIVEYGYYNINTIIQEFAHDLTEEQIKKLEQFSVGTNNSGNFIKTQITPYYLDPNVNMLVTDDGINSNMFGHLNYYDRQGNLLVVRVYWLSARVMQEVTYYDKFGDEQKKLQSEHYVLQENEKSKKFYINEWWQGTKIAHDNYLKIKPCDVQIRSMNNPGICYPPFVGLISSLNANKAYSIVDTVKSLAYEYIFYSKKLKHLWLTNLGKLAVVNMSMIPTGMMEDGSKWDIESWFKWARLFRFVLENPFQEDSKGRVAGNMNQNAKEIDMSAGQEIEQCIRMLEYIESRVNRLTGVNEQRQGDINQSAGLGITNQAVSYSANQTQTLFAMHESLKLKVLTRFIEYTKFVLKDKDELRQYILDDMSNALLELNGTTLTEAEYDVQIVSSRKIQEFEQILKSDALNRAVQSGAINLSDVGIALLSSSPTAMISNLKAAEEKKRREQQELEQQKLKQQEQQQQMQMQMLQMQQEFEMKKLEKEWEYRLMEKQMDIEDKQQADVFNQYYLDKNNNGVEDDIELEKQNLINEDSDKQRKFEEKESQKERDLEIKIAKLKAESSERIAKMRPKPSSK